MKKRWKSILIAASLILGQFAGLAIPMKAEAATTYRYTLYRYKDLVDTEYKTTTSSTSPGDGWVFIDTSTVYGAWGNWSGWGRTPIEPSDTVDVEKRYVPDVTKTQWNYSKWSQYNSATSGGYSGPYEGYWSGIYCGYYIERGWSDSPLNLREDQGGGILLYGPSGDTWYNETTRSVVTDPAHYEYRYRTRSKTIYYNWKKDIWGDWSSWSTAYVSSSDTRKVETTSVSGIKITSDYFPDANFRAVVSSYDTDGDGILSVNEASKVTDLNLNNKGISSLNGIEYFSALTSLDCNDNYLESLDVSGLPELDLLDCSNNRLSSLTLGSGLLGVSCNGNQLTELDLSDASSLLLLNCSDNQLTELNIGNNRQLQELECEDNPIRLVDFRNSSPLKSYCSFPEDTIVVWTDADTGWKEIGDQTYYIVDEETTPKDSHLATGWTTIDGVDYLFTGTGTQVPGAIRMSDVVVTPSSVSMTEWDQVKLTATPTPSSISADSLVWTSGNDNVVKVDASGNLTAVAPGFTYVTVTSEYEGSASYRVPVTVRPILSLDQDEVVLGEGGEDTIEITRNTDQISSVSCTSNDPNIATVTLSGTDTDSILIQAQDFGSTEISILVVGKNGKTCEYTVTVEVLTEEIDTDVKKLSFLLNGETVSDQISLELKNSDPEGNSFQLEPVLTRTDGTEVSIPDSVLNTDGKVVRLVWKSSDNSVANVRNGLVSLVGFSSNPISITASVRGMDVNAEAQILVSREPVQLERVLFANQSEILSIGDSKELDFQIDPKNADDAEIIWVSEDPDIVSVPNENFAKIIAVSGGSTTVSAIQVSTGEVMGSVRVSVRSPEPPKVSFIVMGTGTAAKSGDGYVYTNQNPLADGGILELPHGQAQSVFLRTMINSDADMKELDITKESGATGDAEAVDVTEVFPGLEDSNRIFRIDANRVGDTKFTISAMDGSDITTSFTVRVVPKDEWITDATGTKHYTGTKQDVGWSTISGKRYYFNSDGNKVTGWLTLSGKTYLLGTDGALCTGWRTAGSTKYYFGADGAMYTGWKQISGKMYYFGSNGLMYTKWNKIGQKWYYFGTDGERRTGWKQINKKFYYFGTDGVMRTGWKNLNKSWYYFGTDGVKRTGWAKVGKKWYFFDKKSGVRKNGWVKDGKKWYFLEKKSSTMKTGWLRDGKKWYFFDKKSGAMKTGWLKSGKKWYYFNKSGAMVTGNVKIGKTNYSFSSSGEWIP